MGLQRLLFIMLRAAHRRPSPRRIAVWAVVAVLAMAAAAVEYLFGWPEALTPIRATRNPLR